MWMWYFVLGFRVVPEGAEKMLKINPPSGPTGFHDGEFVNVARTVDDGLPPKSERRVTINGGGPCSQSRPISPILPSVYPWEFEPVVNGCENSVT